jgi:hypothetical protein
LDLSGEYNISATFNVSDISLFDEGDDLRLNLFEEREGMMKSTSNIEGSIAYWTYY